MSARSILELSRDLGHALTTIGRRPASMPGYDDDWPTVSGRPWGEERTPPMLVADVADVMRAALDDAARMVGHDPVWARDRLAVALVVSAGLVRRMP